jgi:hypothetical protein
LATALASGILLVASLLIGTPANAATFTVSAHLTYNGAPDSSGHMVAYTLSPGYNWWNSVGGEHTDASGFVQIELDSDKVYRFCYHSDSSAYSENICWGGDTVDQATSVTLSSNLDLGTIDLQPMTALDMSGVRIQGRAVVGQRLTIDVSSLPTGVNSYEIDWYRDGSLSSSGNIHGQYLASGSFYVVKPGDVGQLITAHVDAMGPRVAAPEHLPGGEPYLTPALGPVIRPMSLSSAPRIRAGAWKKGKKASYVAPAVTPPAATATFQWLRNGKAIKGANKATYVIKKADRKKKLILRVTYTQAGYETTTVQSPSSPRIK